jgi:hypothetical protein
MFVRGVRPEDGLHGLSLISVSIVSALRMLQVERLLACVRACVRDGCARARRGGDIHTFDENVTCVLHTYMTLEAAPGIARKDVRRRLSA